MQRAESQKLNAQTFQQGGFIPLQTRAKVIAVMITFVFLFSACCAPATTSSTPVETAFTATFLGFSENGQYLLAKSERSNTNVQMIYDDRENLVVGQRMYVLGRLEGNIVYVSDLKPF